MKTKFMLLFGSSLLALGPATRAQDGGANTNSLPLVQTVKYQKALEDDRALGERLLLPPGLKEKLKLTGDQRADLKTIEADFASTSLQFQTANQSRIDGAMQVIRLARMSKNEAQIEDARRQLQNIWTGLQPYREQAVKQVRALLTPDQLVILDDPQNQWSENHGAEANDPSVN